MKRHMKPQAAKKSGRGSTEKSREIHSLGGGSRAEKAKITEKIGEEVIAKEQPARVAQVSRYGYV